MATIKFKELSKMNKEERQKKMKELKLELIKSKISSAKTGTSKIKQIKKLIARLSMLNK